MSKIIFVGGTHGSGKSTLARAILQSHGGIWSETEIAGQCVTISNDGTAVIGNYGTACGGLDTYHNWTEISTVLSELIKMGCPRIFAEGVIQYAKAKYIDLANIPNCEFMFINLETDLRQCIENVCKRRAERGNTKEFNPSNVYSKERGWFSIYVSLVEAGVNAYRMPFDQAFTACEEFYRRA